MWGLTIKNHLKPPITETCVKKVAHTSEFLFGIYWWAWKTTIYWKNFWNKPIKNIRIFIFTILDLKKKNKEKHLKTLFYTIIYSSWDTECDRLSHFLPFYIPPLKIKKIRILKKWKNCWRYHHFTKVTHKPQSYKVWFLRYGVRQTEFFAILGHF